MALVHTIIEIRSYYDTWIVICDIEDDLSSQLYHFRWNFDTEVDGDDKKVTDEIDLAKANIQMEILLLANDMNLPTDEQKAIEYFQNVKRAIILEIRDNPTATLAQAQVYIANEYPDSMINFIKLYQWYLNLLGLITWGEFKAYVIAAKFRGID